MVKPLDLERVHNIPGYTPMDELHALYLTALMSAHLEGDIVEIGSWCGRSAVVLAAAAEGSKVHCIDLFPDPRDWFRSESGGWSSSTNIDFVNHFSHLAPTVPDRIFEAEVLPVYQKYGSLTAAFAIHTEPEKDTIVAHRGTSTTFFSKQSLGFKIRMAFIDGGHSYEDVTRDIENVEPHLVSGSYICFDDFSGDFPSVVKGVQDRIIGSDKYCDIHHTCNRLLTARKK